MISVGEEEALEHMARHARYVKFLQRPKPNLMRLLWSCNVQLYCTTDIAVSPTVSDSDAVRC